VDSPYKVLACIRDNVKSVRAPGDVFETIRGFSNGFVRCSCGGGVRLDKPDDLMYGTAWAGCSHIVAMFKGRVSEDRELSKRSYIAFAYGGTPGLPHALPYVELTDDGRTFFGWRWAAIAMEK